jgi:hypothetical protein
LDTECELMALTFDAVWTQIADELRPGTAVQNWGVARGFAGRTFEVMDVERTVITIFGGDMQMPRRLSKDDFARVYAVWDAYIGGRYPRSKMTDLSQNTTYIVSILHGLNVYQASPAARPAFSSTWRVGIMAGQATWQVVTLREHGEPALSSTTWPWFVRCAAIVGITRPLGIRALLVCRGRRRGAIIARSRRIGIGLGISISEIGIAITVVGIAVPVVAPGQQEREQQPQEAHDSSIGLERTGYFQARASVNTTASPLVTELAVRAVRQPLAEYLPISPSSTPPSRCEPWRWPLLPTPDGHKRRIYL